MSNSCGVSERLPCGPSGCNTDIDLVFTVRRRKKTVSGRDAVRNPDACRHLQQRMNNTIHLFFSVVLANAESCVKQLNLATDNCTWVIRPIKPCLHGQTNSALHCWTRCLDFNTSITIFSVLHQSWSISLAMKNVRVPRLHMSLWRLQCFEQMLSPVN